MVSAGSLQNHEKGSVSAPMKKNPHNGGPLGLLDEIKRLRHGRNEVSQEIPF
jgi:hypothetical protein